jgi:hypothetical protein
MEKIMKDLTREQKLKIAMEVIKNEWEVMNDKRDDKHIDRAFGTVSDWLELCHSIEKRKRR